MLSPGRSALGGRLSSAGSLLLLACLLFGQFVATTHEFTALHAACARHGELIEVESQRPFAAASVSADTRSQVSALGEESSPTQHQHCLFVSSRGSQKNFKVVGPVASSRSAAAHWAPSASGEVLRPSLALYLTAPKHSPPAA